MNNKEICINKVYEYCNSKVKEFQSLKNATIVPERKLEVKAKAEFANKLINVVENVTSQRPLNKKPKQKQGSVNKNLKSDLKDEIKEELRESILKEIKQDIFDYLNIDIDLDDD